MDRKAVLNFSEIDRRSNGRHRSDHRRHYYREIRRFRLGSHRYWSHREVRCSSDVQEHCSRRQSRRYGAR